MHSLPISQVAKLTAADGAPSDQFGYSVLVSGDTLVVGAVLAAAGDNVYQGVAYVFSRNPGGGDRWDRVQKLIASDGASWDW